MKRIVCCLFVLAASLLSAGTVKLKTGQVYEGDVKQVGDVVTIIKDGAVFQFKMKEVVEMDGKAIEKEKNPVVKIMTSKGDLLVELFEDEAPNTVANMITLAEQGYFKGMSFHRVVKGFVAQGGCPNSKRGASGQPGTGGPGYMIDNEIAPGLKNLRGSLSMARRAENDTNGSQFFICFRPQPFLDGKYTVFGKVVEGLPVLDKIEEIGTTGEGRPRESVTFNIEVVSKRNHEYVVKKNNKK